jgi:hypothetical protein
LLYYCLLDAFILINEKNGENQMALIFFNGKIYFSLVCVGLRKKSLFEITADGRMNKKFIDS